MANVACDDGRCLISTCNSSGPLKTFKLQAVRPGFHMVVNRVINMS